MNEWKELQIDNLPPDILTGDYEFISRSSRLKNKWSNAYSLNTKEEWLCVIRELFIGEYEYEYRRKEKPAPSHEEIMTKFWRDGSEWIKIVGHDVETGQYLLGSALWVYGQWFRCRESADIPPEE